MKKIYEKPDVKIQAFENENIVAVSNTFAGFELLEIDGMSGEWSTKEF